jgi:hypothetical protein
LNRSSSGLFHVCRILLRNQVHLRVGVVNAGDRGALLLPGKGDCGHDVGDTLHART